MKSKNELFAQALLWLYTNHECKDQKELSMKTGITETTISRILNNKVKNPSADTIGKLLDAFPMIDRDFLYGWSEYVSKYEKFEKMAHDALHIDHDRDNKKKDELIESLKSQIADLRFQLVDKDNRIEEMKDHVSTLKRENANLNLLVQELKTRLSSWEQDEEYLNYPFARTVSDERKDLSDAHV